MHNFNNGVVDCHELVRRLSHIIEVVPVFPLPGEVTQNEMWESFKGLSSGEPSKTTRGGDDEEGRALRN